jgi:hypothetical protein
MTAMQTYLEFLVTAQPPANAGDRI